MRDQLEEMAREIYDGRRELARLAREAQQQEERFKKKERALLAEIQKLALNQKEALPPLTKTAGGEIDGHPCEIRGTVSRTHRGQRGRALLLLPQHAEGEDHVGAGEG